MAPLIFQLLVIVGSLIYFDILSSIVIFVVIVSFIIYSWLMLNMQKKANLDANEAEDIEKANIGDIFTNIDSIKYFGKENFIKDKYARLARTTRNLTLRHWHYFRWSDSGQSFILGLGTFFLVFFSMRQLLHGEITLGTVTFIYTSYIGLLGPLFGFIHGIREYYRSMADFQDLFEYGKIKKEILDKENAEKLEIKQGKIEFKDVSFNYGKRKIFHDFNLTVPENKKIALVGHSGSGKTTLIKLLYRLYDVYSGRILIDNKDIKNITQESLRNEMSVVPQECILFDDTVYNNIAFSKPKASRSEIMKAINFAQLDKIIKKFPNKENTIVGERGVKLSGGEKQRVSIARAILANKKVLVLDEATSSLDSETEHEIQADLAELMKNRTSIIIAHRLSTIMNADEIIVMKDGKIVQKGTHKQLINQQGEYKKLWNLQKGGYIGE
jgi:ATP-binding cassette subfamily B protein